MYGDAVDVVCGQPTCNWAAFTTNGTVTDTGEPPPVLLLLSGPALKVIDGPPLPVDAGKLAVVTGMVTQPLAPVRCASFPEVLMPSAVPLPTPAKLKAKLMSKLGIG